MDIFSFELKSYGYQIQNLKKDCEVILKIFNSDKDNLTIIGLAISNRIHLILIGLCSIVETFLYKIVVNDLENKNIKKIPHGRMCLINYISENFNPNLFNSPNWEKFNLIYDLRNELIHSYGGLIQTEKSQAIKEKLSSLGMQSSLIGDRRIRLSLENLEYTYSIITSVLDSLKEINWFNDKTG